MNKEIIKNQIKDLYLNYKVYKETYEMWDEQGRKCHITKGIPFVRLTRYNIFKYIKELTTQWFLNLKCYCFGHKWNHDCDTSPDSGNESMECACCGLWYNNAYEVLKNKSE